MKLIFLSFLFCVPVCAEQYLGSIIMKIQQGNKTSIYSLATTNSKSNQYDYIQQKWSVDYSIEMYGTGAFSYLKDKQEGTHNYVPGINSKGHSKLTLSKVGRKYIVATDMLTYEEVSKKEISLPIQISSEANIINGSWKKYLSGESIFFEYTQAATNRLAEKTTFGFDPIFKEMKKQIEDNNNMSVSAAKIIESTFIGRSTIVASLDELTVFLPPFKTEIKFDIYLN